MYLNRNIFYFIRFFMTKKVDLVNFLILFFLRTDSNIFLVYVDEILFVSDKGNIDKEVDIIKKIFNLSVERDIRRQIGCELNINGEKVIIHQKMMLL